MATKIETPSGFTCEIDEERLDDFRFLELLRETEKNATAYSDLVTFLLGEDKERLMAHLALETGRVPVAAVRDEVTAIMQELSNAKKK